MEKIKQTTADTVEQNIEKLTKLFPNVITEKKDDNGNIVKAIDFEKLKQELSRENLSDDESYDFTWVGKRQAIIDANTPTNKTLRPCKAESVNWDNTENIYIEGDNLEVLKILQETYLHKIKMIYIDPPYNTGKDSFLYEDNRTMDKDNYEQQLGLRDEEGNKQFKENNDSNPRFHSVWCSMMYSRLKLAKNLLTQNGVIFISIDDHEIDNMIKICNEIFGENHVDKMIWRKSGVGRDGKMKNTTTFRKDHEYIIVCFNDELFLNKSFEKPNYENEYGNPDNDPRGPWISGSISRADYASNENSENYYEVTSPTGNKISRQFEISKEQFLTLDKDGRISWGKYGNSVPRIKIFINEKRAVTTSSYIIEKKDYISTTCIDEHDSTTTKGSKELEEIMNINGLGAEMRPKPTDLIVKLLQIGSNSDDIILDFFSGSGTTAHSCFKINVENKEHRCFIMVQYPEQCDETSEAYKAGYKNICDIGKERIRRAGKKIVETTGKTDLDIGFRVFKLDESNMKDVYFSPDKYNQDMLEQIESNIKEDRNSEDLLFSCMLNWGLELSLPHKIEKIENNEIHIVNENELVACFDKNITEDVVKRIAEKQPLRVVFRDNSFGKDSERINVEEIFKLKSPNTKIKVL